jgi:hypothetical protein
LVRCPAGKQLLPTWVFSVVPTGASLRGSDMSLDMRLVALSEETAGSDESKPLAVSLSGPLFFAVRQARPRHLRMSSRPREIRVASRRRRLLHPCHQMSVAPVALGQHRSQGVVWLAKMNRPKRPAR